MAQTTSGGSPGGGAGGSSAPSGRSSMQEAAVQGRGASQALNASGVSQGAKAEPSAPVRQGGSISQGTGKLDGQTKANVEGVQRTNPGTEAKSNAAMGKPPAADPPAPSKSQLDAALAQARSVGAGQKQAGMRMG